MVHRAPAATAARRRRDTVAAEDESLSRASTTVPACALLPLLVHHCRRAPAKRTLVEPGTGRRIRAARHARSVFAIACAATQADDHAHWKLKPPIRPSISSI